MAQAGYTPISLYYSTTPASVPTNTNLIAGELAINIVDGKLYYKDNSNVVQLLASKDVNGNVVGPASATDNAVVRFDGTTGKLIQNSAVTIADTTGNITGGSYNKLTITPPATSATLTIADGKTLITNNSLTLSGTDSTTMTFPSTSQSIAGLSVSGQIFTTAQTFRATDSVRAEAAATQDAVVLKGRAGGTNSYAVSVTPATLSANRTFTLPDLDTTAVGTDATQTLTNKRINPRAVPAGSTSGNLTINGDTTDLYEAEGLTGPITFLQPSGTPVDGQKLMIRIKDDGTARAITWTTSAGAFRAVGITLPTTTVLSKVTYVGCVYNSTDSFWDAVATVTQA